MGKQLTTPELVHWLLRHNFTENKRKSTGHRKFTHQPTGTIVNVVWHGPKAMQKGSTSLTLQQLERAGFDRKLVRQELNL